MQSKPCAFRTPRVTWSAPFPCGKMCAQKSNTICNMRCTKRMSHLDSTASWMPHNSRILKGNDVHGVAMCPFAIWHLPICPCAISPSSLLTIQTICTHFAPILHPFCTHFAPFCTVLHRFAPVLHRFAPFCLFCPFCKAPVVSG